MYVQGKPNIELGFVVGQKLWSLRRCDEAEMILC